MKRMEEAKQNKMTQKAQPRKIAWEKKSFLFLVLALITFNASLVVILIGYVMMRLKIREGGYEGSAYAAFLLGIPFLIAITIFLFLSWYFHRKAKGEK